MNQNALRTEFELTLPCGYQDEDGSLHREVLMRRATAADEILPLKDPRVVKNPAYLVIILLSRVIERIGALEQINPGVIERLYATDLAFLQREYNRINALDEDVEPVVCPECGHVFRPEESESGGSAATPSISSAGR
ncbi:phage tail assembly protein [Thiococcus pfennigii]|uniref:phage tail assembly protein n=1 Tax=Thiococcus pfennigii TaxID=1057 RepID=UPI001907DE4D|nr:phage tail assembly protein [Thiococcus pfennigii]MBK1699387.1 hypothetical protein [Thiococcus pfennigii]